MRSSSGIDSWPASIPSIINDLPNCPQYTTTQLFADYTNITASGKSIEELERTLNLDLVNVKDWLVGLLLYKSRNSPLSFLLGHEL